MLAFQFAGVAAAARVRNHVDFLVHVLAVMGHAQIFFLDCQSPLQALVVRGHAGGTGIGMASERLYATSANMKPRAVLTKSAPTHRAQAAFAEVTSLPAATTRMRLFQIGLQQRVNRPRQGFRDRQRHVVHQRLRRRAAAAFAAVYG